MPIYKHRPNIVRADMYKKDMEDGFTLSDYLPEGICKGRNRLASFLLKDIDKTKVFKDDIRLVHPYINTLKEQFYIERDDYIVEYEDGSRKLIRKDEFEKEYELINEGGD